MRTIILGDSSLIATKKKLKYLSLFLARMRNQIISMAGFLQFLTRSKIENRQTGHQYCSTGKKLGFN